MVVLNWDRLSGRLKQAVDKRDKVVFTTQNKLPKELRKYGEVNGFQTDDGTVYILTDVVARYGGDAEGTLKHEIAHRILRHKQVQHKQMGEHTRSKTALDESIRHERDVNVLLYKTYDSPSAEDFKDEIRAHIMGWTLEEGGPSTYGEIFAAIKQNILESSDVPDSWKTAIKQWRREAAQKLVGVYGHDVDYAEWVLSQDERPVVLNNLVKHAWYGMSSYEPDWEEDVQYPEKYTVSAKKVRRKVSKSRRSSKKHDSIPISIRGLR